ncbi:MAG: histidine phosphatase family protein [Lactobacillus sp.]
MAVEVYLIRHGETMFNQLNKVQGWCDSPLTPKGIADLKNTAQALSDIHFDKMYSSDLKRAIDTVHLMQDANKRSVISKIPKLPSFREVFFGSFEGDDVDATWALIAQQAGLPTYYDVTDIINAIGLYDFREATKKADPRHLAEDAAQLDMRTEKAIRDLRRETRGMKRVLLVSHGDFIKTLAIKYWTKSDHLHDIIFPDNGSVTIGHLTDDNFVITDYDITQDQL